MTRLIPILLLIKIHQHHIKTKIYYFLFTGETCCILWESNPVINVKIVKLSLSLASLFILGITSTH